jgi:hypothetical protein
MPPVSNYLVLHWNPCSGFDLGSQRGKNTVPKIRSPPLSAHRLRHQTAKEYKEVITTLRPIICCTEKL